MTTPTKKPIFILSFFTTYWPLLIILALFNWASHRDEITYWVGPTFYLFLLVLLCVGSALFGKHLAFRQTVDAYTQKKEEDGKTYTFVKDFWALPAQQRVWMVVIVFMALFLGSCWIAASLAK